MDETDIDKARRKRAERTDSVDDQGWMQGPAQCLTCGHKWQAVAPAGTTSLECPACKLNRGVYRVPFDSSGTRWQCRCGCDVFQLVRVGAFCIGCGLVHEYAQITF